MNSTTMIIAASTAAMIGFVVSLMNRRRDRVTVWPLAFAVAVGWSLLRVSSFDDLMRVVQPKVALDWTPGLVLIAAAIVTTLGPGRVRWIVAAGFGLFASAWLLSGSIHLREIASLWQQPTTTAWMVIWAALLAALVALHQSAKSGWFSGSVLAWAITLAATAIAIATTGSLAYAAATGVAGAATVGALVGGRRLHPFLAVPASLLIGLAAAFSELNIALAAVLQLAWVGLMVSNRNTSRDAETAEMTSIFRRRWAGLVTSIATAAAVLVAVGTVVQFSQSADEPSGYAAVMGDGAMGDGAMGDGAMGDGNEDETESTVAANDNQIDGGTESLTVPQAGNAGNSSQSSATTTGEDSSSSSEGGFDPFGELPSIP